MNPVVLGLIVLTGLITHKGLIDQYFFKRYAFQISGILRAKQWDRLISSVALHVDWVHFGFNMFALYLFAGSIINFEPLGLMHFLGIYVLAGIAGNLMALLIHKNEPYYTAVGASGAVSGVVFAAIAINPTMKLSFILLPFLPFPAWVFAIGYLLYSVFGLRQRFDNLGHSAHLGGALLGMVYPLCLIPQLFLANSFYIFGMLLPVALLFVMILKKK